MQGNRTVTVSQRKPAELQTCRQPLAIEGSPSRTSAHHRLIAAGNLSSQLTSQSCCTETLNPSSSQENHPTTMPALKLSGEPLPERQRTGQMMSIPFQPVRTSMRPPVLVDLNQQLRSRSDIMLIPSPASTGLSSLPTQRSPQIGPLQRADADLDPTPSLAYGPSSATPSVPQTLQTPSKSHVSAFPVYAGPSMRPRHPAQAHGWSSTSPPGSGVRTIRIGIESEIYLKARGFASTRHTLEEFVDNLAANHNRQWPGHPQMRRTLRPYKYDGNYYGKWCFVKKSTISTKHEPCKLFPFLAIP